MMSVDIWMFPVKRKHQTYYVFACLRLARHRACSMADGSENAGSQPDMQDFDAALQLSF